MFIGNFLHSTNSQVETRTTRVIVHQRKNNRFIMQLAIEGNFKLKLIHQCCLWLQVCTLADIYNASGCTVENWIFGTKGRKSTLRWMTQGEPSPKSWREWKKLLKLILIVPISTGRWHLKHTYNLGAWYDTHQIWRWMGNCDMAVKKDSSRFWRDRTSLQPMAKTLYYVPQKLNPLKVHETRNGNHRVCDPGSLCRPRLEAVSTKYHRLQGDVLCNKQSYCYD